jgi:hypothetical protein
VSANPFFEAWTTPFEIPPFDRIETGHFREAYDVALSAHKAEIAAIINDPAKPDFDNTIVAMERSGEALKRVGSVFWNLAGTESTEALRAVEREMSPLLARHYSEIFLDPTLFARVDAVYEGRTQGAYSPEQLRVIERKHKAFIRAGAKLGEAQRQRLGAITEELATLGGSFVWVTWDLLPMVEDALREGTAGGGSTESLSETEGFSDHLFAVLGTQGHRRPIELRGLRRPKRRILQGHLRSHATEGSGDRRILRTIGNLAGRIGHHNLAGDIVGQRLRIG